MKKSIISRVKLKSKQIPLEFQIKETRFKKMHKIKYKLPLNYISTASRDTTALIGLKAHNYTIKQLLAILKIIKPDLKQYRRWGRANINIKVNAVLTRKPKDTRMGRGKGAPSEKVHVERPLQPLLEIHFISSNKAARILHKCAIKSPIKSDIINIREW